MNYLHPYVQPYSCLFRRLPNFTYPLRNMKKAFLLTVLLCSINSLIAQKKITTLRLKAGDIAIQGNMEAETITKEFRKGRFGEWTYTVLAFEKPITNIQQLALKG